MILQEKFPNCALPTLKRIGSFEKEYLLNYHGIICCELSLQMISKFWGGDKYRVQFLTIFKKRNLPNCSPYSCLKYLNFELKG